MLTTNHYSIFMKALAKLQSVKLDNNWLYFCASFPLQFDWNIDHSLIDVQWYSREWIEWCEDNLWHISNKLKSISSFVIFLTPFFLSLFSGLVSGMSSNSNHLIKSVWRQFINNLFSFIYQLIEQTSEMAPSREIREFKTWFVTLFTIAASIGV